MEKAHEGLLPTELTRLVLIREDQIRSEKVKMAYKIYSKYLLNVLIDCTMTNTGQ